MLEADVHAIYGKSSLRSKPKRGIYLMDYPSKLFRMSTVTGNAYVSTLTECQLLFSKYAEDNCWN